MKLYVWENPYKIPYGHSIVFAIASNLREAKKEASNGKNYSFGYSVGSHPDIKLGKPTRIISLPCAEWHRWEE